MLDLLPNQLFREEKRGSFMTEGGLGLQALLCCVFEKEEGPIIQCSDPPEALRKDFKPLGRYLLPDNFATGRVVSVLMASDSLVLGAPVYIEDTVYDRNCFQFNICALICKKADAAPHRNLAHHLAKAFMTLEMEHKLLSDRRCIEKVRDILAGLRRQLNQSDECFVRVGRAHCISFRVSRRSLALPPAPGLSTIPIPMVDLQQLLSRAFQTSEEAARGPAIIGGRRLHFEPDPAVAQVAPFVDGIRNVAQIVHDSEMDEEIVLLCLRHLLHFNFLAILDPIGLDKRYRLTPTFHTVLDDLGETCTELVRYVTAGKSDDSQERCEEILALYAGIDGWMQTFGEFREARENDFAKLGISWRHFITFGLLQQFIEPIGNHAQALSDEEMRELQKLRSTTKEEKTKLKGKGLLQMEVNKDPAIQKKVARMGILKSKDKGQS